MRHHPVMIADSADWTDFPRRVEQAAERIRPHILETPVEPSPGLGQIGSAEVVLKLENLQRTGSFKLRGAMNKLLSLPADILARGVVTASSGNHGAAVAWGLRTLGSRGIVFVPEDVSRAKLQAMTDAGAEVRAEGRDCGLSEIAARNHARAHGLAYIPPYNDPDVVAGQGTLGLEIARQAGEIDAVFVALGGGGLVGGIGAYLKGAGRRVTVVACSAENSAVMHHSIAAGRILEMASRPTLSDGTAGAIEPGTITFGLCRRVVDESLLVNEREIAEAMRLVIGHHHTLVEGAAGLAVAGYLKTAAQWRGRRVAIVLCGANIAIDRLREVLGA